MTPKELEERRAARAAKVADAKAEQLSKDLEAVDAAEEEHGGDKVAAMHLPYFTAGMPTLIVVVAPSKPAYKRYRDQAHKSKGAVSGKIIDELADVCVVYPDVKTKEGAELFKAMCDEYTSLRDNAFVQCLKLAEAKSDDEKKG